MSRPDAHWSRQKELAASDVPVRFLIFLVKLLPFPVLACIVPFVSFFYYICSPNVRRVAADYQRRLIAFSGGKALRRPDAYAQVTSFSLCLVEKVSAWSGKASLDDVIFHDDDVGELKRQLSEGKGAMLITSHLGNMELLRCLASYGKTGVDRQVPVTAIMDMQVSSNFTRSINRLNARYGLDIIPASEIGVDSLERLQETLAAGGLVVIAGDRTSASDPERSIRASFLGSDAPFPFGSFMLASLLDVPVYFVFALREPGCFFHPRYNMFVTRSDVTFDCSRKERKQRIRDVCLRFAGLMEGLCLAYPYQWYNFFDFWLFQGEEGADGQKDPD